MNLICGKNGNFFYYRSFVVNQLYEIGCGKNKRFVRFIHVTPKGFNLLDIETGKCILMKRHLYSRDFFNKPIPSVIKEVRNVAVPGRLVLTTITDEIKI